MPKKKRRKVISRKKLKEKRLANYPIPIYSVGDLVQINDDVMYFDWNDLLIGDWVGEVTKVHRNQEGPQYDVRWTDETLAKNHPVYEALAQLECLTHDEYSQLAEQEIHKFAGGEVILVAPDDTVVSKYADRPLDPEDTTDRLRMIFGAKPLDWFPTLGDGEEEDDRLLRRYYDCLLEHLAFPFMGVHVYRRGGEGSKQVLTVQNLIDPDVARAGDLDISEGLYCSGIASSGNVLEVPLRLVLCGEDTPEEKLVGDYRSWIGGPSHHSERLIEALAELKDSRREE